MSAEQAQIYDCLGTGDDECDLKPYKTVRDALEDIPGDAPNHQKGNHSERVQRKHQETTPGASVHGHQHQFRLQYDEPANTVTASNYDYHPEEPRGLTIREQARLQTFPDYYEFIGTKTNQQRQLGNAVPPRLGEAIAEELL